MKNILIIVVVLVVVALGVMMFVGTSHKSTTTDEPMTDDVSVPLEADAEVIVGEIEQIQTEENTTDAEIDELEALSF